MNFDLVSAYKPTGDQPQAISKLIKNIKKNSPEQVLLGVTGSGKTFTMANVIAKMNLPVLVISHNKTLAAQLYQEFNSFFPKNAVSYFVSYYDYYQPEAYIPQTDTYIEKETDINEEIDKLRLAATSNILTRKDTIVVASVSAIYNIGSAKEYGSYILEIRSGVKISRKSIIERLIELQYERNEYQLKRGAFRVRGDTVCIYPSYLDYAVRFHLQNEIINQIEQIDPLSSEIIRKTDQFVLYPAKHYLTDTSDKQIIEKIYRDLNSQIKNFNKQKKFVEAQRLSQKVNYDLEMIKEVGYVNGIENYSRYFDGRKPGDPPNTLINYYHEKYGKNWLLIIDESHMTIPQIRGMYEGDRSRKNTLVNFGFRLPAALDNRPLRFDEFLRIMPLNTIYVSATPSVWEKSRAHQIVEQLVRPTGLPDPEIIVRSSKNQINDLISEIDRRTRMHERVLVTTLTKRTAEDLTVFLKNKNIRVEYLHSDIITLERTDILDKLRQGSFDVLVGINLLREGLDLPEVSLVVILDADKEGFLRSEVSLIQTMGRAARHIRGTVIMYADNITGSMKKAIHEVTRRRQVQLEYNIKNRITPRSISKPLRDKLTEVQETDDPVFGKNNQKQKWLNIKTDSLTPRDKQIMIRKLEKEMKIEARELNFELAAQIRDKILQIKSSL